MDVLYRQQIDTPLGAMLAVASDSALCVLEFHRGERLTRLERRIARWFPPHTFTDEPNRILEQTRAWLRGYFDGSAANADLVPIDMRGAEFERRVWDALREIPAGETRSYGDIARRLGDPGASRAVGTANGANPVAIIVPCHRVIGANGSLVGYGGGLDKKTWLLNHERRWRTGQLF
jgi:O-6-methylguanine DNA methyltransferase